MADNRQTLILLDVGMGDEGRYECVSSNIGGSVTRFQLVKLKQTTQQSSVYSSQIAIPIYIAAGVALFIAIVTLIGIKCCCKRSIKSPATPPTPRLTQYEQPEDTESCRLTGTLRETRDSRDTVSPCHGFHQYQTCQTCTYNGLYGYTPGPGLLPEPETGIPSNIMGSSLIGRVSRFDRFQACDWSVVSIQALSLVETVRLINPF